MKLLKKKKKIKTNFLLLILLISLLFFFLLGSWSERYQYDKKINSFVSNSIEIIASNLRYSFSNKDKIIIDIKFSDYEKLGMSRLKMIRNGKATKQMQIKVPAKISLNDQKLNGAQISIKGTHSDHWEKARKWSFKINLDSDDKIFGKKEFSLQHPATRGYIYEWLFMKFLKHENLISHKVSFLELIINGENLGLYNFTEAHTKELLSTNNRVDGPIVFYDKQHWIKETSKINNLGLNDYKHSFYKASVNVVNKSEWLSDPQKKKQLNKALYLLEAFKNKELKAHEVFDVQQIAKIFAIKAIFGSVEFDWKDIKFYYNPKTKKLEPIGREIHVDLGQINYEPKTWWLNIKPNNFSHSKDQVEFLKLFYDDLIFYEYYLKELNRVSSISYFDSVLKKNFKEFNRIKSIINGYFPHEKIYSKEKINAQIKFIRDTLNPVREINAYFLEEKNNHIILNIENLQNLPIKIVGLELANSKSTIKKNNLIIKGFSLENINQNIIKFKCDLNTKCFNPGDGNQIIIYSILGQNILKKEKILPWSNVKLN